METIYKVVDRLCVGIGYLGGIAIMAAMLHVVADVVGKILFRAPIPGTTEIVTYYYMVAIVFLPLALVERGNRHISVDLLAEHLSPSVQRKLIGVVSLASVTFYGLLTWVSLVEALEKAHVREKVTGSLILPIWPSRFFLPIGCGFIALLLVIKGLRLVFGDSRPLDDVEDESH